MGTRIEGMPSGGGGNGLAFSIASRVDETSSGEALPPTSTFSSPPTGEIQSVTTTVPSTPRLLARLG